MSGTGPSHIAVALGFIACVANPAAAAVPSAEMRDRLTMSLADGTRYGQPPTWVPD